jgi:tetratricopeptide (TPR) repeat protein
MKTIAAVAAFCLAVGTASAQRHKITIGAETPEGALLQQIEQETDDAKKIGLLEQFAEKYPKHEGAAWVYEMQIESYAKTNQPDKVIAAGEKLIAIDPEEVYAGHACLKAAAETKADPELTLQWAPRVSEMARKVAATPKPEEDRLLEYWTARVDYAKQLDVYTEYTFYAMALRARDPKTRIALGETLMGRSPESQYVAQIAQPLALAYIQSGDNAKAVALCEKALAKDPNAMKQPDKVIAAAAKAAEAVGQQAKPEGVADADWQARKVTVTTQAKFLLGVTYAAQEKWMLCDEALRAALPGLAKSPDQNSEALFYLGLANYRLAAQGGVAHAKEALEFSEQCAALPGRYQSAARTNARAIRQQFKLR